ncbi:bifunctional phosphoserine phosphatase/homoserine phosphotransferase ThrH [Sphingomonas sp. LB3N6]|uniref:bifunctional phosphoserine phosphatase/homoserine phosphotransferase ThrH n=1 Tax=Sphingomonas fucosidasi TaxID=3096164 RepID=UPI002FC7229D
MRPPLQIFCDLEGVLVPEMWPHVAVRLDIPALAATTRVHPDYAGLVAARIATLRAHGVTLAALSDAVADVTPYEGAVAFIATLRRHGPVTLVTDSFAPMNTGLIAAFKVDRVLNHRFVPDARGFIAHCVYWNGLAGKQHCLAGIKDATVAIGDAFNYLPLLHAATCSILFRPSPKTRRAGGSLLVATTYTEVTDAFAIHEGTGVLDQGEF